MNSFDVFLTGLPVAGPNDLFRSVQLIPQRPQTRFFRNRRRRWSFPKFSKKYFNPHAVGLNLKIQFFFEFEKFLLRRQLKLRHRKKVLENFRKFTSREEHSRISP